MTTIEQEQDLSIEQIIEAGSVRSVYQPIVDLDSGRIVAYEALARGPVGSALEFPDRLFAAAAARGLTTALDWACRAAALEGALRARLGRSTKLFVNVEPSTFSTPRPASLDELFLRAASSLDVVVEITERALIRDPAALIATVRTMRELGMSVAIDDVGAEPASLALLPFIEPDIVKLDLRLVHERANSEIASISAAVRADAERRHATILAEGIETEEHLRRALVLGARLGQGWLFGRPGALPAATGDFGPTGRDLSLGSAFPAPVPVTPWSVVEHWSERRTTTKRLLLPMSRHVESRAADGEPCVLLSAFQDDRFFTALTKERYEGLAPRQSLVGVLATGMGKNPARGVRGGSIPHGHALAGEWAVTVVGPHDAVALIARDADIECDSDMDRVFEYVITHDRATVVAAARSLMQYVDAN